MSKTLSEIRVEIDAIDNQVHDLLMQRASLVAGVADAKKKEGLQIVQPAREARMIRRLLARHKAPLPKQTVVRIWRELVGSVSLLQTGLSVAVVAGEDGVSYWDMAKNYFGSVVPMKKITGSANAVAAVRNDENSFAVMPWPELDDEKNAWWIHLFDQQGDDRISIICALPYGAEKEDDYSVLHRALVVSKIAFLPSDDDNTFLGLELDADISRARIMETVEKAGLPVLNLYSASSPYHEASHVHLVELQGYFTADAPEVEVLKSVFDRKCLYCGILGGYPVIPEIEKQKVGV